MDYSDNDIVGEILSETGEILPALQGEKDRYLTESEKEAFANGKSSWEGNQIYGDGVVAPHTLFQLRHATAQKHILKRQARQLGELEGYIAAHRDEAARVYGAKLEVINGLMDEMSVKDPDGNVTGLDTRSLNSKRLKILFTYLDQWEKRAYGAAAQNVKHEGSVDVNHIVAQVKQGLIESDD